MLENAFRDLTLFRSLTDQQAEQARRLFAPVIVGAQEQLFGQGDPAEYLYIVVQGEVQIIYKPDDGHPIPLTRVQADGVVGWSAALGNPVYTSSVVCETDCLLLRARAKDLRLLCENHPDTGRVILDRLATIVAERLHSTHQNVLSLLEQGMHLAAS